MNGFPFAGDLDALTRLVLVNGIYFKGKWKSQFDAKKTQDAPFYATPSNPVQVKMMEIETDLPYADIPALDAKGVSLPYLVNGFRSSLGFRKTRSPCFLAELTKTILLLFFLQIREIALA